MAEKWSEPIRVASQTAQQERQQKNSTILEKKTYGYLERDEEKIEEFKLKISQIHPDDRVHIIFT